MRSLEEILRTYNIVNSRSVSRYTIRFTAVIVLAGIGVLTAFLMVTGGPDQATVPEHTGAQNGATTGSGSAEAEPGTPLEIITHEGSDWVYIGYAPERYDPALKDEYDPVMVGQAVLDWLAANPTRLTEQPYEEIHHPDDGILMGYRIRFL